MSWLDGLSAGLTAATQGAGGYLQGQEKGREKAMEEARMMAASLRQKHIDEQNALMQSVDMKYKNAQIDKLGQPVAAPEVSRGAAILQDGKWVIPSPFETPKQPWELPGWKDSERFKASLVPRDGIVGKFDAPDPSDSSKNVTMGYDRQGNSRVLGGALKNQGSRSEMQRMQAERSIDGTAVMVRAHNEMSRFEDMAKASPQLLSAFEQAKGEVMAHIPQGANLNNFDIAEKSVAIASLYKNNPELANYIRNTMMYTFGQMETLPRTSDFRTRYEQEISGIKTGMPAPMIDRLRAQRQKSIYTKSQTALSQSRDWGWDPDQDTQSFHDKMKGASAPQGQAAPSGPPKPFASLDAKSKLMASKDAAFRQHLIDSGVTGVP